MESSQTLDNQFVQVAERVPGFGGMFYDENGDLNIYLVDPEQEKEVKEAVVRIFGAETLLSRKYVEEEGLPPAQRLVSGEVKILQGQYDFLQLRKWYGEMGSILSVPGVVFIDIDEARNRLGVGIEKGNVEARKQIEPELAKLTIPREAVLVEETEPIGIAPANR